MSSIGTGQRGTDTAPSAGHALRRCGARGTRRIVSARSGGVKEWQQANPERVNENHRRNNARPERKRAMRDAYYRRTFGISADEFDVLLEAQGGCCAICRGRPERAASLHLDHCHDTGAIRGILCGRCNQGLGLFGDDVALLDSAVRYLRQGVTRTGTAGE